MKNIKHVVLIAAISALPLLTASAQEGKYKVKIIKDKDGKKEVYEKDYTSREEMANDPNLGEMRIVELDSIEGFKWESDTSGIMRIHIARDGETSDRNVMVFSTDEEGVIEMHGEEGDSIHSNVFVFRNGNKTMEIKNDVKFKSKDGNVIIMKGDDSDEDVLFWNEDGSGDKRVIVRSKGGGAQFFTSGNEVQLEEATTGEIRSANFLEEKALVLRSVEYQVNTGEGTIGLKFQSKSSPVSIEVRDTSGTQVYEESVDPFNGSYSGKIDLSGQKSGTYILEIRQGQKSVYKKLEKR